MSSRILCRIYHVEVVLTLVTFHIALILVLIRISLVADILQQLLLFLPFRKFEGKLLSLGWVVEFFLVRHFANYLERVALIDQELLSFVSIVHLLGVSGDQRVEISIVVVHVGGRLFFGVLFGAQNATEALSFLLSGGEVRGDLDDHVCCGQIN